MPAQHAKLWESFPQKIKKTPEFSNFKSLGGDKFGDFLKIFEHLEIFIVSKSKFDKLIKTKKLRNCILH